MADVNEASTFGGEPNAGAMPSDTKLPFFSYGLFRPGEIGFRELKRFVASHESKWHTKGFLLIRDGLPLLDNSTESSDSNVPGVLIHFLVGHHMEAYKTIAVNEPKWLYRWEVLEVGRDNGRLRANVLVGRNPRRGSQRLEELEWSGRKEPLFNAALDVVRETLESNRIFEWDLKPMFRPQMAYLLLWSAIERFAAFKYHLGDNVMRKVKGLAGEQAFVEGLREVVKGPPRTVFRADKPQKKEVLDPSNPEKSLDYYYQVRSNVAHRGKAAVHDHEILCQSIEELAELFRRILAAEFSMPESA